MKRPIYSALYMLMIVAMYFFCSIAYQSCGSKKEEAPSQSDIVAEVEDNLTEETFFEDDIDVNVDEVFNEAIEESTLVQKVDEDYATSVSDDGPVASARSLDRGGFVVVAGNYLLETNASEMVKNLKKAGYNNAKKVVFDLSQYYTVIAGNYESRSLANSISSELSAKGIDNYVLKRKE